MLSVNLETPLFPSLFNNIQSIMNFVSFPYHDHHYAINDQIIIIVFTTKTPIKNITVIIIISHPSIQPSPTLPQYHRHRHFYHHYYHPTNLYILTNIIVFIITRGFISTSTHTPRSQLPPTKSSSSHHHQHYTTTIPFRNSIVINSSILLLINSATSPAFSIMHPRKPVIFFLL